MAYVKYEYLVLIVDEIVIAGVGVDVNLGPASDRTGYELSTRASAQRYARQQVPRLPYGRVTNDRRAEFLLDAGNQCLGSHGLFEVAYYAESDSRVILSLTLHERPFDTDSQAPRHLMADSSEGAVEGGVRGIYAYAVAKRLHHGPFDRRSAGYTAQPLEYQRMVTDYQVTPAFYGFGNHSRGTVDAEKHTGTLFAARTELQSGIVPRFLKRAWCEFLYCRDYFSVLHLGDNMPGGLQDRPDCGLFRFGFGKHDTQV